MGMGMEEEDEETTTQWTIRNDPKETFSIIMKLNIKIAVELCINKQENPKIEPENSVHKRKSGELPSKMAMRKSPT